MSAASGRTDVVAEMATDDDLQRLPPGEILKALRGRDVQIWPASRLPDDYDITPIGTCVQTAQRLVKRDPSLKVCFGFAVPLDPNSREVGHLWLLDHSGAVIDPSLSEHLPVGKYVGALATPAQIEAFRFIAGRRQQ